MFIEVEIYKYYR